MKKLTWNGENGKRVGLWDGRYLSPGESIEVDDTQAEELLARDARWTADETPSGQRTAAEEDD